MVTLKLDQSLCGENEKRAYGLLRTSISNLDLAKNLASKSDLRDHTNGIDFGPAVRGFAEDDHYVILKTFKDRSPDVRPNRIFTHMLSGELKAVTHFGDLGAIFGALQLQMDKITSVVPITVTQATKQTPLTSKSAERFYKLVNGYTRRGDFHNTLVWIGQEGYEDAVSDLWQALSPNERADLNFGIYFSAENISPQQTNVICVPEAVQSKFNRIGYFIVSPNDSHSPEELSEKLLIGDKEAIKRINAFAAALGLKGFKRDEIDTLTAGIKTFEDLDNINDLKKLNTLSHIVAKYAQEPTAGNEFKSRLLKKMTNLIPLATTNDLVVLRLFKIDSFKGSKKNLETALVIWLQTHAFTKLDPKFVDLPALFEIMRGAKNWLAEVLVTQFKHFLGNIDINKAKVVYQWAAVNVNSLVFSEKYIDRSNTSEDAFIKELPTGMGLRVKDTVLKFAAHSDWIRLYADILKKTVSDLETALKAQLTIDRDPTRFDGLQIILKNASASRVLQFTALHPENRLITYCGKLCHDKPILLRKMELKETGWQLIWLAAVREGNELKDGLRNVLSMVHMLLDLQTDGKVVIPELLSTIADSTYANILNYTNRPKLWKKLNAADRQKFLLATSTKLLESLSRDSATVVPDDPILSAFIISDGIADFLYYNRNKLSSTLPIFLKYAHLPQHMLIDYLRNYWEDIVQKDAVKLGRLIESRNLVQAAEIVFSKASKKNNWRFALNECHHILPVLKRGYILGSGILKTVRITVDEWFEDIGKLIIEFYPNHQSLTTVWKKAGGKEYDLPATGTTQEIWLHVLHRLRHRAYSHLKMNDLLREINKDYGHNDEFKLLYEIRRHFIKT